MVYLIGGSSHVGKTLTAGKLMERLNIPFVSLDHIKMGLIRGGYTDLSVAQDGALREYMWPLVREMIKTVIENGQDLIIEGCYIPGDWRKSFTEQYLNSIRSVFIVMSEDYIRAHEEDIIGYGDIVEHRVSRAVNVDRLVSCSAMFEQWAEENGAPVLKIDSSFSIEDITEKVCIILGR